MSALFLSCLAYLLGSFPSGLVLGWLLTGMDIRKLGSGNIGAANVASTAGRGVGIAVGVLDICKGLVPVLLGRWLGLPPSALALVALAAVLGHDFSLFLRFRGGKGVATTIGVSLILAPLAAGLAMIVWLATWLIWRYASLASLVALAALPFFVARTAQPASYVVLAAALFVLGTLKHWENIVRLAHGKEPKAGERRSHNGELF